MTSTSPTSPSPYTSEYHGFPRCDTAAFTVIVLNRDQQLFSSYKEKRRTLSQLLDLGVDTTNLAPRRIKSYASVFTGLKGPKKIIIVDANNNHDFSDDAAFEFDTLTMERDYRGDTIGLAPLIRVHYETATKQGVQPAQTYLRLMPYNSAFGYPTDMRRRLAVYTRTQVYREGNFVVDGQPYKVSAATEAGQTDDYRTPKLKIQLADLTFEANKEAAISVGKQMLVGDRLFTLVNSTRDGELTLAVKRYDPGRIGGRVNNRIPALLGKTADGSALSVNDLLKQGKYVLLDFWGSWCGPCIASMPALKALHNRVDDQVRFVGIDYEYDDAGRQKAQKLASDQQFSWMQLVEYAKQQTTASIPRQLDVSTYPTFMLFSPDGRILVREVGEDGLKKIEERLAQLKLLTR